MRSTLACSCAQPHERRNVQRLQRARADDAVAGNAVALLELLHRRLHIGIERRRVAARLPEVAGGDQPPAQLDDARIAHADLELHVGRHARPAAARHQILVDVDRLLHRRHGLRREDRHRRRDRPRDQRLRVEALLPIPTAGRRTNCPVRRRPARKRPRLRAKSPLC